MKHFLLLTLALSLAAAPSITSIETTAQQAIVRVTSANPSSCTIAASRGLTIGIAIQDITDNGASTARIGTVGPYGTQLAFVLGTRKGNDSLASAATYATQVTCSDGVSPVTTFSTKPIQWGNTAPDIVPFNAAKFGNMDHPTIDWANMTTPYVDPNTGVEYWRITKPGWAHVASMSLAATNTGIMNTPIDITGGKWATAANAITNGVSFSVGSGGPADKLFIPVNTFTCPAGGGAMGGFAGYCNPMEDVSYDVYCGNGAVAGITLTLQLTVDGGQTGIGTPVTTTACPTTAPVKLATYPQLAPNPPFLSWGTSPPKRNAIKPPTGTVSTNGTAVTLTSVGGSDTWFNLDWPAGTPILINGTYAHLAASPVTSTALTTMENLGILTNVPYTGANFGVILTKSNNLSNVSVSVGINYAFGEWPYAGSNGDNEMSNQIPVSVTRSADGTTCTGYPVGCAAGVLSPALSGYLTILIANSQQPALMLWIPFNSDGTPRAETRLLSTLQKPSGSARQNCNGDACTTFLGGQPFFDNVGGNVVYAADQNGARIWKLSYNESYVGCVGYQNYSPYPATSGYATAVPIAEDCFDWLNVTPLAGGHDIHSQIVSGYQTGLNYLGATVGPTHTGFDLGWLANTATPISISSNFLCTSIYNFQNGLAVLGCFDFNSANWIGNTAPLKAVRNFWNEGAARYTGAHSVPLFSLGPTVFAVNHSMQDTSLQASFVFANKFEATLSQVNRAGFGSAPVWDSNTALTSTTDYYPCPTSGMPAAYAAFQGTPNCIQLRITTPLCNRQPNSAYIFPDGKIERTEFPCITPGFGNANVNYSKLQDMQIGDWLNGTDTGDLGEHPVIVSAPVYNALNDITFWVLRTAGFLVNLPAYGTGDDTGGAGHSGFCSCTTHANGWGIWAAPQFASYSVALNASNSSNTWQQDNVGRFFGHGSPGFGTTAGTYNYSQGGSSCTVANVYCGNSNSTVASLLNVKFTNQNTQTPTFGGVGSSTPMGWSQSYANATQANGTSPYPFFVDWRSLNPAGGSTIEGAGNTFGNAFTMTLVGGTTKTYLVSADCCTASPDYKRWGLSGQAGRFLLTDVSSPTTFGAAADMADWSVCKVLKTNECVFGSTVGQFYMTVPKHDIQANANSANFGLAVPALTTPVPWLGALVQYRIDQFENTGRNTRKFGFAHNRPGLAYSFANCRVDPTGRWEMCPGYWLDGISTQWLALRIDTLPPIDSQPRTDLMGLVVSLPGGSANARVRFGYAENGDPATTLRCAAYAQDCSSEIPSGSPSDPYSFTNEAVTRLACSGGCTITVPALPNRIVYWKIDRLDSGGNILDSSPLQVKALP